MTCVECKSGEFLMDPDQTTGAVHPLNAKSERADLERDDIADTCSAGDWKAMPVDEPTRSVNRFLRNHLGRTILLRGVCLYDHLGQSP
jgi:hypothetical protein